MKNSKTTLLLAALTLMSVQVQASKARVSALQNSATIADDFQYLFEKPSRIMNLSEQVTFEYGAPSISYATTGGGINTTSAVSPNSEGGFFRNFGSSKLGAYVGRQSDTFTWMAAGGSAGIGSAWNNVGGMFLDNPLNILYGTKFGDMNFGANLTYATSSKKFVTGTPQQSKSTQALTLSVGDGVWEANASIGLGAQLKDESTSGATAGDQIKADAGMKISGLYNMGSTQVFADFANYGASYTNGASGTTTSKLSGSSYTLGVESFIKGEGTHFFYGAKYSSMSESQTASASTNNGAKGEITRLPLTIGVEADATSWMVVRGAISQSVLLATKKTTLSNAAGGASFSDSMLHDTSLTAGAGFKFNKINVDFLLAAGGNGALNMTTFGTNTSLTYTF